MTVLRFSRKGNTHRPVYHLVVADSRQPLNGKFIEKLGHYNPTSNELQIDLEAVDRRQAQGAQASKRVAKMIARARKSAAPVAAGSVANL